MPLTGTQGTAAEAAASAPSHLILPAHTDSGEHMLAPSTTVLLAEVLQPQSRLQSLQ